MSQDDDPLDATRQFQPIDPYNIGPDDAGAPELEYASQAPTTEPRPRGFPQRLAGLGALRLAALGTGLVLVLGGVAWGATALAASGSPSSGAQAQDQAPPRNSADGGATGGGAGTKAKPRAKAARVTIKSLGAGTFTGTDVRGETLTVVYSDTTRFGTKARPLTADQLQVGMAVTVAGTREGDKITALLIALPAKKADDPASDPSAAVSTDKT
ncbi:MAG: hypothetical protein JF587_07510 [Catenulisporales bacterium]|nr:hypothetical protein [Catenulisporales bacterium]